jgi:chromate transporter
MKMTSSVSLLFLFCIFFYIGLITIGGGLVGITIMQQVIVEKYHLITPDLFYNMVAISESTPGPIGINMATYIGTELYGVGGGIITTAGQVLPSLIIIMLIARFFERFHKMPLIDAAFSGLRPATTGIIAVAAAQVFIIALLNIPARISDFSYPGTWEHLFKLPSLVFYGFGCLILFKTKLHPVFLVFLGAVFGIVFC